ncbi:VOC family protein [Deminuibacter soli]|uniref:VOC family protein n=2 Tax=Deminuibacter soli TaxID=2291815 RepID=A0A3E1NRQ3_9BACT|nr:VOC family protein [Deminuibacter soli]
MLLCCTAVLKVHAQSADAAITPHFNHTTVYVVDMQKSNEFYQKVLLLKVISEPFHDNKHTWYKMGEHGQLHIVQGAQNIVPHDINIHLAFSVASLPDFMKHLDALHIKYGNWKGDQGQTQARPDKIQQVYLQDPDGYWIEVNNDQF